MLLIGAIVIIVMVGFRYRVGGDWMAYQRLFRHISKLDFWTAIQTTDPAYAATNWLVGTVGFEVWGVNLICAIVFTSGLVSLCRWQPNPPLAMLVAVPYLVTVVAMGYTRQGAALGCVMLALTLYRRGSLLKTGVALLVAAAFHKSAIVVVPLFAMAHSRDRIVTSMAFGALAAAVYYVFVAGAVGGLYSTYVLAAESSEGAQIRSLMNVLPALFFLGFRSRFGMDPTQRRLWTIFALMALGAAGALIYSPSSTVVDRVGLFLIPLQVVILSRLPAAMGAGRRQSMILVASVTAYSLLVQLVWLLYAAHADAWLPYRSYLWQGDTVDVPRRF